MLQARLKTLKQKVCEKFCSTRRKVSTLRHSTIIFALFDAERPYWVFEVGLIRSWPL